mmetsp:Transcript_16134/g.20885  ORF Transcript_16134/g.20885 Transcript_16134/m.20885 type:complete len:295 (+) Transcript_16134:1739-2623(+)
MLRGIDEGAHATCITIGPAACVSQDTDVSLHVHQGGSFAEFTTSVILGMDPAPRLSVANVERLVKDLNDKTVAATAASAAAAAGASLMGAFRSLNSINLSDDFDDALLCDGDSYKGQESDNEDKTRVEHTMGEVVEMAEDIETEVETVAEGAEINLVAPGCLLHIDDEVELASSPSVVAFPVHSSEYDRVALSYSLMSYHLPQRYLAALLAAVEIPSIELVVDHLHPMTDTPTPTPEHSPEAAETPNETSVGETTSEEPHQGINETQFMIRFEHISSAFDISQCPPQSPVSTNI